jgi:hypothetical protein
MNLREAGKMDWTAASPPTHQDISTGAMQRIADAVERVAANYDAMVRDRDYWRERARENGAACERLRRSVRAYRGVVARLKSERAR